MLQPGRPILERFRVTMSEEFENEPVCSSLIFDGHAASMTPNIAATQLSLCRSHDKSYVSRLYFHMFLSNMGQ